MDIKIKVGIILIGLYIIIISNSCGKNGLGCANTTYNFEIGVKAYPNRDSIRVGDTVWLEINVPTTLTDISSNTVVNYSGATNLGSAIGLIKLIGKNNAIGAANMFNYYLVKGININNPNTENTREYKFTENDNRYIFKLGIISKEKGAFKIFVSNATSVYRKNETCTKAGFEINFENTDQHLYLNKIIAPDVDLLPGGGVYLFKVY